MDHKLNLIQNSLSYFHEAVEYAAKAQQDVTQWKFAIINLVQAMELALKESLRRIHPAFVFENVDSPLHSVSISKALQRLSNPIIGNSRIIKDEQRKFEAAIKLRNELTHFEFSYNKAYAEAEFASLFAFMVFYYQRSFDLKLEDFISLKKYFDFFTIQKTKDELLLKAKQHIIELGITDVLMCPDCFQDTFVVKKKKCFLCQYEEEMKECEKCGELLFGFQVKSIESLLDIDYADCQTFLVNDFGYRFRSVCENCFDEIKDDIESQRRKDLEEYLMQEYISKNRRKRTL